MRANRAYRVELLIRALVFCLVLILGLSVAVDPTCAGEAEAKEYFYEGGRHFKKGDYDAAIIALKESIRLEPNHSRTHVNLGIAYYMKDQYDLAIASFKEAIRLKPDFVQAHYLLGSAYLEEGDRVRALEEYKLLKELDPDEAQKLFNKVYKD